MEEERIAARHEDMDWSVKEEVKNMSAGIKEQTAARSRSRKPTFVGAINTGRAFSHNMQGIIASVPDFRTCPEAVKSLRTTDEFCDKYRALRMKVDMHQEENNRLRKMLEDFLTPDKRTPPTPKE